MCSLNEVCESVNTLVTDSFRRQIICRSCEKIGNVVLRRKDIYCRDCFLTSATHKFRATLGKSKMMKPSDNVLVALSGNQSSFALLHMLYSAFTEQQNKRFTFNVHVVFIEDSVLHQLSNKERIDLVEKLKEKILNYKFPYSIVTLSECLCDSIELQTFLNINEENEKCIKALFDSVETMSSKEDLLQICRQKLLYEIAKKLQCNKIFVDDVGNDLAIKLLSCFSLGRGDQASLQTGFCNSLFPDCKILRPLREFTKKEITFYNHFHKIDYFIVPTLTTKLQTNCSIQKLTEKFVADLQEKFPSTVYTIFRTGEKLGDDINCENITQFSCLMCKNKIKEINTKEYSVINNITNFSKILHRNKLNSCNKNGSKQCCCKTNLNEILNSEDLEKFFCYGCLLILRDTKNLNLLPNHVLDAAIQRKNFDNMKKEISEFLLVED